MSKQTILNTVAAELNRLGVPFKLGQTADLTIVTDFADASWGAGSRKIHYEASLLLDEQSSIASFWEKTVETSTGLSMGFEGESSFQSGSTLFRKVVFHQIGPDGQRVDVDLDLGSIARAVKDGVHAHNWRFKNVLGKNKASYAETPLRTPAPPAPFIAAPDAMPRAAFCSECGKPLLPGARFCANCGKSMPQAAAMPAPVYQPSATPPAERHYVPASASANPKTPIIIALVVVALVVLMIFGIISLMSVANGRVTDSTTFAESVHVTTIPAMTQPSETAESTETTVPSVETSTSESSADISGLVISEGISPDDNGNIVNGQFYFQKGDEIFFPNYDIDAKAHIYRYDTANGTCNAIFNGYGWSLVVFDGWVYFAGNESAEIDGNYYLYRVRADGSEVQRMNDYYNYALNIYQGSLYYVRGDVSDETNLFYCKSELDGSGEVILMNLPSGNYAFYNNYLYYVADNYTLCQANPDGSASQVILDDCSYFIVTGGQLVYNDYDGNIMTADLSGNNRQLVLATGEYPIYSLNAYNQTIYYTLVDETYDEAYRAFNYGLYSIAPDGTANTLLYSGMSYGTYVNIANDRIFVIDFAQDPNTGYMPAIARSMALDGSDVQDLPR